MFKCLAFLVALIFQFPTAYVLTSVPPQPNMQPLGAVDITILYPENHQLVYRCQSASIDAYVVWVDPQRESMYWVTSGALSMMVDKDRLPVIECTR